MSATLRGKAFKLGVGGRAGKRRMSAAFGPVSPAKLAANTAEAAAAMAASLAEAEVLRAAAAAPPDEQTITSKRALSGHVLPISAGLWNEARQHIVTADADSLRLWSTRREVRLRGLRGGGMGERETDRQG